MYLLQVKHVLTMFGLRMYSCSLFEQFCPPKFPFLLWLKAVGFGFHFWAPFWAPTITNKIQGPKTAPKMEPKQEPKYDPNQDQDPKCNPGPLFFHHSPAIGFNCATNPNNFNQRRKGNLGGQNCSNREHEYIRRPNIVKTCFTCRRYTVKSHAWENQQHACYGSSGYCRDKRA